MGLELLISQILYLPYFYISASKRTEPFPDIFIMRLLTVASLQLEEPRGDEMPEYAIRSHTSARKEVSLQEMRQTVSSQQFLPSIGLDYTRSLAVQKSEAYAKGSKNGLGYIDKTRSAELTEATNPTYR